jgi:hypothetical protein
LHHGIFCQPTAASNSAQGELRERSTAQETINRGSRCDVHVRKDIRLWQEQKGEPLNYFIYPYAESNGQPIKGLTTHFAIRDLSPPALKTREIE